MKKRYKKPNICEVDFEILDLILASGDPTPGHGGDFPGWEPDDDDEGDYIIDGF